MADWTLLLQELLWMNVLSQSHKPFAERNLYIVLSTCNAAMIVIVHMHSYVTFCSPHLVLGSLDTPIERLCQILL